MPSRSTADLQPGPQRRHGRGRPHLDPTPLLLGSGLTQEEVTGLLAPYGFTNISGADATLQSMAGEPGSRVRLAAVLEELLSAVAVTADPEQALIHWDRYLQNGVDRGQLFDYLARAPRILHLLCRIFGNSPALAQTLIRDPFLVYWLADEKVLSRSPSQPSLAKSLREMLDVVSTEDLRFDALRRFGRREMFRIGVRDLMGLNDVQSTTTALSDLAAVLIQAAYEITDAGLRLQYGPAMHRDRDGRLVETGFTVMGMGKLGGGELNYSSDVDLIFLYASDDGMTKPSAKARVRTQPVSMQSISNEQYFEFLARGLTRALTEITQEGRVFRVDLRLRAEGSTGRLARSLDGYGQYYNTRGQTWERLALLKAWPVAGDASLGRSFLRKAQRFVFGDPGSGPDKVAATSVLEQVRSIKRMIDEKMASRGHEQRNVKLGTGGIREIEFIVQAAQVLCGGCLEGIRDRNTINALSRLGRYGLLSKKDVNALDSAYRFLRNVEHKLQMVHDLQTHALPELPEELTRCAVRLGYSPYDRRRAVEQFLGDHRRHTARVNLIFRRMFDRQGRSELVKASLRRGRTRRKRSRRV